jgi:hypothetical protein
VGSVQENGTAEHAEHAECADGQCVEVSALLPGWSDETIVDRGDRTREGGDYRLAAIDAEANRE